MAVIKFPYDKEFVSVEIPDFNLSWVAKILTPKKTFTTQDNIITQALANPIGSPRLSEIVDSGKKIAIIVDDVTRPTPVYKLLPHIFQELYHGGALAENIKIVIALGTHRIMSENEKKAHYGDLYPKIEVVNVDYLDKNQYVYIGTGSQGEPIEILKTVYEADIKIGVGNIVPHLYAGWGGGAKIIQPGVCSEATTEATHTLGVMNEHVLKLCTNPENMVRKAIEYVTAVVGLDFIVNTVLGEHKIILNVFTGNFIKAHRAGVKFAEQILRPKIPELVDILITTAYPSQIDYWQGIKGLIHGAFGVKPEKGIIIFNMAANEGLSGGNEKHTRTILDWASKSKEEIKLGISQRKSNDLIGMAFCLAHRQMVEEFRVICISTNISQDTLACLGFIPAKNIDDALKKAFSWTGKEARVGVVTYAGIAVHT